MVPSPPITATAALTSPGDLEQAAAAVRAGVGPRADLEAEGAGVLAARAGSAAAYRLLGVWAGPARLPVRARFELTPHHDGTQVMVDMASDQGWYLVTSPLARRAYQARFEALVADLQRAGLSQSGPIEHRRGGRGAVAR